MVYVLVLQCVFDKFESFNYFLIEFTSKKANFFFQNAKQIFSPILHFAEFLAFPCAQNVDIGDGMKECDGNVQGECVYIYLGM